MISNIRFRDLSLLILVLALTACASNISNRTAQIPYNIFNAPAPSDAESLWNQAEAAYSSGNYNVAIDTWNRIADFYPTNAIAARSLSRIGRLFLDKKHPETALDYFDTIIRNYPQWPGTGLTRVDRVEALLAKGDYSRAEKEATELWNIADNRSEYRTRLCAIMAKIYLRKGDIRTALDWLSQGLSVADSPKQKNRLGRTAITVLDSVNTSTVQEMLKGGSAPPSLKPFLEYRLARIEMDQGQTDTARKQLMQILANYPDHPVSEAIRKILEGGAMITDIPLEASRIGCLLPLTGNYAGFGEQVLRGLALAVEDWNRAHPGNPVTLVVKDTRAQPEQAKAALESLARDYGVLAVLGPLSAKCTDAIALEAGTYGIPLLTFTQNESVEASSPFLFHLLIENRGLVASLINNCQTVLGYERFAVLYPEDRYGKRLARVFTETLEGLNEHPVASVSYKQGTTDFKLAIRELLKQAKQNASGGSAQPAIQALFIPDQAQTVALIAPQLPYYNMISPTLLGTNLWDDPTLLQIGGVYVENALFATAFPVADTSTQDSPFRDEFRAAYNKVPHYFEAQAYDGLNMLLEARELAGPYAADRLSVQQNLANMTQFEGLTGTVAFLPDGTLERNYLIYKIMEGGVVQVGP